MLSDHPRADMALIQCLVKITLVVALALFGASVVRSHDTADNHTHLSDERRLYRHISSQYIQSIRPVNRTNETVTVYFGVAMVNIADLHEKTGILELNAWMRHYWKDSQLLWSPADFGGIERLVLPATELWKPDIVLYTNAADDDSSLVTTMAHVTYNGMVLWVPHVRIRSWCSLDMYKFPFDVHTCKLTFGSWSYPQKEVDIQFYYGNNLLDLSVYGEHQEWEIHHTDGRRHEKIYPCCPETYPNVQYEITLKRRPSYYSHVYLAPAVVLVLLIPCVFMLPPAACEKIVLGTGILVTLVIMLSMLESFLPATHVQIPAIALFYVTCLVLVSISQFLAVCVINLARRNSAYPPPRIVSAIFVGFLGRILCVKPESHSELITQVDGGNQEGHMTTDDDQSIIPPRATTKSRSDWTLLALVFDRLLLLMFTIVCVVVSVVLFAD